MSWERQEDQSGSEAGPCNSSPGGLKKPGWSEHGGACDAQGGVLALLLSFPRTQDVVPKRPLSDDIIWVMVVVKLSSWLICQTSDRALAAPQDSSAEDGHSYLSLCLLPLLFFSWNPYFFYTACWDLLGRVARFLVRKSSEKAAFRLKVLVAVLS